MEILHVCPSRSFSGLEQYALQLAKFQKNKGLAVSFVVCPATSLESECQRLNIKTIDFHYDAWRGRLFFWRRITKILAREKNLKAIHLHMTDEVANISFPIFWRRIRNKWNNRPKVIFQAHIWINHKKKDLYHRLLYSNIDEVWCSSEPARKALIESLPLSPDSIKIFNYGRDIAKIKEEILEKADARKFLKLEGNRIILGTVTRIEEAKGIRELIEASVPILEKAQNLELVIIGGPSPNNPEAEAYDEKLITDVAKLPEKLKNRIHFKGGIPESYRFLKAFDLYVLPSYLETFSLSLLDAQLAGLSVVGSQSGGTPEIVKKGETGWLFEPQNVASLRNAITEALSHPELWARYGQKAQQRVEREFDQKEIFEKMIEAYGEGIKEERPKNAP
jgi:D-inositol-3-phosphate glycosyltransferase